MTTEDRVRLLATDVCGQRPEPRRVTQADHDTVVTGLFAEMKLTHEKYKERIEHMEKRVGQGQERVTQLSRINGELVAECDKATALARERFNTIQHLEEQLKLALRREKRRKGKGN